ncbi:unnamed protein product [Caenorhabditis brenneri]
MAFCEFCQFLWAVLAVLSGLKPRNEENSGKFLKVGTFLVLGTLVLLVLLEWSGNWLQLASMITSTIKKLDFLITPVIVTTTNMFVEEESTSLASNFQVPEKGLEKNRGGVRVE